jgi:hypothetical protein
VALLYPGDRAMRDRSDPAESRFAALFAALAASGIRALPAVYHDDFADEVQAQLSDVEVVLAWCNPIEGGRRRDRLDALLAALSAKGVFVSAHPEAILRLGTKDVLYETRDLPFGSDVARIESVAQLDRELPSRLRRGARVLKQHRGHSGIGVWRVELVDPASAALEVRLRHAQRDSDERRVDWAELLRTMAPYFDARERRPHDRSGMAAAARRRHGPRLPRAGSRRRFRPSGRQRALPGGARRGDGAAWSAPVPRPRRGRLPAAEAAPRRGLGRAAAPAGRPRPGAPADALGLRLHARGGRGGREEGEEGEGGPRYVLCEINVSSVSPFPASAIQPLVAAVAEQLERSRKGTGPRS